MRFLPYLLVLSLFSAVPGKIRADQLTFGFGGAGIAEQRFVVLVDVREEVEVRPPVASLNRPSIFRHRGRSGPEVI